MASIFGGGGDDDYGQPRGFGGMSNSLIGMGMGLMQPRMWYESPMAGALQGWQAGAAMDQRTAQQQQQMAIERARLGLAQQQANREPEAIRQLRAAGVPQEQWREILYPKVSAPPPTVKATNPNTGEEETYVWDQTERRFKPFQLGDGGAPQQGATTPVVPGTTLYWPQQQGTDQTQAPTGQPRSPADLPPRVGPKAFEPEQQLRKEFQTGTKVHGEVRQSYNRLLAAKDDAAGDIALIFGYMRMLDPGSVVREGEFATAQNSAGVPDMIRNMYNRALAGTRLTPQQREQFKGQAGAIYEKYDQEYNALADQYRGIARQYRIDPVRVIPDLPRPQVPPATQLPPVTQVTPPTTPPQQAPVQQKWTRDRNGRLMPVQP